MTTPLRKALLIRGPGGSANLDQGGKNDILVMLQLLLSPVGGSWTRQEISILDNPSASRAERTVNGMNADYTLTYFTGHGGVDGRVSFLGINKYQHISELSLINNSPRQLIMGDHCRTQRAVGIAGIPEDLPLFQTADWWKARRIFDQAILASPNGVSFAWAASLGQPAWGDSGGGRFTMEMVELAHRWLCVEPLSPIYLERLIACAGNELGKGGYAQNPEYLAYRGALRVPFALTTALPAGTVPRSSDPADGSKDFELFPELLENPSLGKDGHANALALAFGVAGALWLLSRGS